MEKNFIVEIPEVHFNRFRVKAKNRLEALDKMMSENYSGISHVDLEYSHSLEKKSWIAREEIKDYGVIDISDLKKYTVFVPERHYSEFDVLAESERDALDKVASDKRYSDPTVEYVETNFSHEVENGAWRVVEVGD